jgi:tetratricopeptide (TPR) repeat protein
LSAVLEVTALESIYRGDLAAAETILQDREKPEALHLLGMIHLRRGEGEAAERLLRRAIERDGTVAAYHNDLGNALQDRGRLAEAIACYRRALRLHPRFAEAWNDLGTARYAKGELEAARECYRRALALRPDHLVAYGNLGAVCRKLGLLREARQAFQRELWLRLKNSLWPRRRNLAREQLDAGNLPLAVRIAELQNDKAVLLTARARQSATDEAAAAYEELLKLEPRNAEALAALAEHKLRRGEVEAAEPLIARALALRPREAALHAAAGEAHHRRRRMAEAEAAYRRALELEPLNLFAHVRLSELLRETDRAADAEAAARAALEIDDEAPAAHVVLGMAQRALGRAKKARESFERALELDPRHPQALSQLAHALREDDRLEEAEKRLRAALRERPAEPALLADLGMILADQVRYAEALALFDRALAIAPQSVLAINRKALALDHLGRRAESHELLREAVRLAPHDDHAHYNLGLHYLKFGAYAEGWEGYEHRRTLESFVGRHRRFPLPEWDGGPLAGKCVLVLPEQGLGDEIMFSSCVPDLAREARHVIVECDPKLEAIFRRSFPACTVVARTRTLANDWITRVDPRPELQLASGSLGRKYRQKPSDFPQQAFLKADAAAVASWKSKLEALGPGRKIGLSWRGGVAMTGKKRRSFSLADLEPVLRLPGVQWVNLQYTDVREELKTSPVRVHHWQEAIDDYDQTAALVGALDGVLTVCTAIVHLSGALGRPALVMVPFGADWRYGGEGERMIWYPTVRLVRQREVGDWTRVLEEVSRRIASNTFS